MDNLFTQMCVRIVRASCAKMLAAIYSPDNEIINKNITKLISW